MPPIYPQAGYPGEGLLRSLPSCRQVPAPPSLALPYSSIPRTGLEPHLSLPEADNLLHFRHGGQIAMIGAICGGALVLFLLSVRLCKQATPAGSTSTSKEREKDCGFKAPRKHCADPSMLSHAKKVVSKVTRPRSGPALKSKRSTRTARYQGVARTDDLEAAHENCSASGSMPKDGVDERRRRRMNKTSDAR